MISAGMTQPSASASPIFRASHPASFHTALRPATTSTVANAAAAATGAVADRGTSTSASSTPYRPAVSSQAVSSSSTPGASAHHAPRFSSASRVSSASMTSHSSQRLPDRQRSLHGRSSSQQFHEERTHTPQSQRQSRQATPQGGTDKRPYVSDQIPQQSPSSPQLHPTFRSTKSLCGSEASSPSRIKVRDLSHIQSFASEEILGSSDGSSGHPLPETGRQYEISSMPVTDIIEMVAGLLTKIATTNDLQHEHLHRNIRPPEATNTLNPQTTSILAFRGNNVPAITILSYLTRIHKYCPTTYEVFLSLLVYFDRMTTMRNKGMMDGLKRQSSDLKKHPTSGTSSADSTPSSSTPRVHSSQSSIITPPSSDYADMRVNDPPVMPSPTSGASSRSSSTIHPAPTPSPSHGLSDDTLMDPANFAQYFVVDSYNIHRLVIAGVTCASKFFSDVFYTNSRYAKVGGLPLLELNHLELQFLLLNDFRLAIPVEELEAYGTMLVEFYAREVVTQQKQRDEGKRSRDVQSQSQTRSQQ